MKVQLSVELTRPHWWPRGPRSLRRGLVVVAVVFAAALPMSLAAAHRFTDVPTSDIFHAAIDAIARAGITTGCTSTTYCPEQAVTRGQMGAFLHRGLGRVAMAQEGAPAGGSILHGQEEDAAQVQIHVGGTGASSKQYVTVDAVIEVLGNVAGPGETACPCQFEFFLVDDTGGSSFVRRQTIGTNEQHTLSIATVFDAAPGTHTYKLRIRYPHPANGAKLSLFQSTLMATTSPFLEGPPGSNEVD
jgi:hypothetical protein